MSRRNRKKKGNNKPAPKPATKPAAAAKAVPEAPSDELAKIEEDPPPVKIRPQRPPVLPRSGPGELLDQMESRPSWVFRCSRRNGTVPLPLFLDGKNP